MNSPGPMFQRVAPPLFVWWSLWGSALAGLGAFYFVFAQGQLPPPSRAEVLPNLAGFVPLFLSVVLRWLVLPRYTEPPRALVVFILGLALAETCGIFAVFFGGPYRDALFLLGILGIVQYRPYFAKKFFAPKETRFMPNR